MIRKFVLAAVGAAALLSGSMLMDASAFAGINSNSPPEPYTAPDPVYAAHEIRSTVDMTQPKDKVVLTGNGSSPGAVAK